MYTMVPRSVYFRDGIAIGTFPIANYDESIVMDLPTEHYDFLGPISIVGKTKDEINEAVCELLKEIAA